MLLEDVLAGSEPLIHLEAAHDAAWSTVDRVRLEHCRRRVAMLLGNDQALVGMGADELAELAAWPTSVVFDDADRACLAFTEQFVIDVASMTDDTAGAVSDHLGDEGLLDFVNALLVIEQRQRLELIWEQVL